MKFTTNRILFLTGSMILMLLINSCSKYEDGPSFSLRTKKARLTGEWSVASINNENPLVDIGGTFEFEKDGGVKLSMSYEGTSYKLPGSWDWGDAKESIEVSVLGQSIEFEIKRLTNKELWLEDEDGYLYKCEKV